ncbi:hypothetical protein CDL12_02417 [Handroanthus impetiginosus]|uniref:Uncharacterized protein n=1 Tax=Handroanthus impetiginosus TaxID=429701 RepID=A0A2G9GZN4_9LAMI|nr:hypothetical protein CDL12_16690 [Handroanthus impetiginosus]PIN24836.1 hypothetical protein CDL12_02417 [Handroanthus impetiginosus]
MKTTTNTSATHFLLLSSALTTKRAQCITPKAAAVAAAASASSSEKKEKIEIRVCTNRTCRKQGSLNALQVLSGIAPPFVTVNSCGCLGRCGSGPNIVILPEGVFVGHCGTPSKAADTMAVICGVDEASMGRQKCLEALALRKRAEDEMGRGDFARAFSLLSQAIDLKPFGGVHIIYKERSAARLAMGDINGALEDAKEALDIAPSYPEAYICEGDVLMAMDQLGAAEESYSIALDLDPSIRRSKLFKARLAKLQEKLAPTRLD